MVDPVEDMKIKGPEFAKLIRKIEIIEQKLATHPLMNNDDADSLCALCERKAKVNVIFNVIF